MVDTKIMNIWMNGVESSGIKAKSFFCKLTVVVAEEEKENSNACRWVEITGIEEKSEGECETRGKRIRSDKKSIFLCKKKS